MEDCCAVCAESLDWVAYGSCGHRDLCSNCVVRLRFILGDRHCCICKSDCPTVFVTKALGSFTETKSDFSEFLPGVNEGQHGKYWYHEDSRAYFDDVDHYKMIRAMCRLSCSICDKNVAERRDVGNRRNNFRNIEQLKGHLYHQHRMLMCSLCLEGRKVFISEQKLYNRSQLSQHISSGDSEVDGSESERGGFAGHPLCEFCRNPYYGDAELYMHMSTEHYTCHICQRQHPGHYDYYRSYDDLEAHFRQDHFLCEDDACLAKKFVVFQAETEMKRHNATEHGGHMSRSKRNAALQIPVSFRYRRSNEHDQWPGRWQDFQLESTEFTDEGSLEMAVQEGRLHEASSSIGRTIIEHVETNQSDMITSSMESLDIISHYEEPNNSQSYGSAPTVEEISFPPLSNFVPPAPSSRYAQVLNQGRSAKLGEASFPPLPGAKDSIKPMIAPVSENLAANTIAAHLKLCNKNSVKVMHSARPKVSQNYEHGCSSSGNFITEDTANQVVAPLSSATTQVPTVSGNGFATFTPISSVWNSNNLNRVRQSASAPTANHELNTSVESLKHVQNVQTANKSLVESILAALGMDEEKFATFKTISTEYRQDQLDTCEYLSYVEQFGLSHLVLELAQLCPDPRKQREMIDAYNANLRNNDVQVNMCVKTITNGDGKKRKGKRKGKGKALADNDLDQDRKVQTSDHLFNEVKILSNAKDHETTNSMIVVDDASCQRKTSTDKNSGKGRKKNLKPKVHKISLGIGGRGEHSNDHAETVPIRGVWLGGSSQKLFSQSHISK